MKTKDVLENIAFVAPAQAREPDHEVQMARSELYRAGKCAIDLHNMLKRVSEQRGLEGWVQAKITKAADYLESVYHYLDYEMKDQSIGEGAPVGGTGPVAPGAVPVGGALGASVSPAQAAAMAAKSRIDQKKQIEAKIKELEMQKQQLQRQLATAGQVQETTGAGAFASSIGGNGLGKSKDEVGSLFGGTYKTKKKKIREADKTRVEPPKLNWPEPQLPGPKDPTDPKNMRMGLDKSMIDPNEPLDPSTIRLTPADRIREGVKERGKTGPKFTGYWKGKDKNPPGNKMVGSN